LVGALLAAAYPCGFTIGEFGRPSAWFLCWFLIFPSHCFVSLIPSVQSPALRANLAFRRLDLGFLLTAFVWRCSVSRFRFLVSIKRARQHCVSVCISVPPILSTDRFWVSVCCVLHVQVSSDLGELFFVLSSILSMSTGEIILAVRQSRVPMPLLVSSSSCGVRHLKLFWHCASGSALLHSNPALSFRISTAYSFFCFLLTNSAATVVCIVGFDCRLLLRSTVSSYWDRPSELRSARTLNLTQQTEEEEDEQ
jgi:hypothetical protein